MFGAIAVQVFIGSPSDLPDERLAIRDALEDWNALNSEVTNTILCHAPGNRIPRQTCASPRRQR